VTDYTDKYKLSFLQMFGFQPLMLKQKMRIAKQIIPSINAAEISTFNELNLIA